VTNQSQEETMDIEAAHGLSAKDRLAARL